jgi:hypothetical protein
MQTPPATTHNSCESARPNPGTGKGGNGWLHRDRQHRHPRQESEDGVKNRSRIRRSASPAERRETPLAHEEASATRRRRSQVQLIPTMSSRSRLDEPHRTVHHSRPLSLTGALQVLPFRTFDTCSGSDFPPMKSDSRLPLTPCPWRRCER